MNSAMMDASVRLRKRDAEDEPKQEVRGSLNRSNSDQLALTSNPGSFLIAPKLILLPPSTNLYDTPASWLLRSKGNELCRSDDLATFLEQQENDKSNSPDFASDNRLLRDLLSWKFSDRMVSVVIQKFGETLILQGLYPMFTGPLPALQQHNASLVSGFDVNSPEASIDRTCDGSGGAHQSTPLEEQVRLKSLATQEILNQRARKKNGDKQKRAQLLSKLHCRIMEGNDFKALSPEESRSFHQWQHKNHCVALTSDVVVYSHKKRPTSLNLRDEREGPHSKASVARLFLDNVMAGVPQLAICWHEDGVIRRYDTMKTNEIPEKLNRSEPLDVSEIEKNASALLEFLKSFCTEDMSTHWLFKSKGDHVARLWRLDPLHDCSLDWEFRDKVLYQMGMLCLRASHGKKSRVKQWQLLTKCLEWLDAAAEINQNCGGKTSSLRRALRAGVRERLVDIILSSGNDGAGESVEQCNSYLRAMSYANESLKLLDDEENDCMISEVAMKMICRSKCRLREKLLGMAHAILDLTRRTSSLMDDKLLADDIQCAVTDAIYSARALIERMEDPTKNIERMVVEESLLQTKILFGQFLLQRAKAVMMTTPPHDDGGHDTSAADEFISLALGLCFASDIDANEDVEEDPLEAKLAFLRGNAWNERGKLLLAQSRVFEANDCFEKSLSDFQRVNDKENIGVVRLNIAHCFRVAASQSNSSSETRATILHRAEAELLTALDELSFSREWQVRIKADLFRTRMMLGLNLPYPENMNAHTSALDCAGTSLEQATAFYHLGTTRSVHATKDSTELRLARRNLERVFDLAPKGHILRMHAKLELCMLRMEKCEDHPEKVLASLVGFLDAELDALDDANLESIWTKFSTSVTTIVKRWIAQSNERERERLKVEYRGWIEHMGSMQQHAANHTPRSSQTVKLAVTKLKHFIVK